MMSRKIAEKTARIKETLRHSFVFYIADLSQIFTNVEPRGQVDSFMTNNFTYPLQNPLNRLKCRLVADQKKVKPDELL
jgi:hypothetical protein